jgi:hypothetical protein
MKGQHEHTKSILRFPFPREYAGFHTFADFENAPPITFAIKGILQNDGATFFAGLPGHGKTLILLSLVKALLAGKGTKLWDHFDVLETAGRILYLTPEVTITPFKHRAKLFDIYRYVKSGRLIARTLSLDSSTSLADPDILAVAKGSHIFLDSAIRFVEGKENDASDNQRGLGKRIFDLLRAGARSIVAAHHSPKAFAGADTMTLENMLRGTGDIGAVLSAAFGVKQLDAPQAPQNILHIQNLKPRDFEPCPPFQIIGRPYIDREHDFRMYKKPGECRSLAEEKSKGGASPEAREQRAKNKETLRRLLQKEPKAKAKDLAKRLQKETGVEYEESTIRRLRAEIRKEAA